MDDEYDATPEPHYEGRVPPQDREAEKAVLGAMLQSREAIEETVEILRGPDFYHPNHEALFDAIVDMYSYGLPVDMLTVREELTKRGIIGKVGGPLYLHELTSETPAAGNAAYYAQNVLDKAVRRRLADAATRIEQMARSGAGDLDDVVDEAHATLDKATPQRAAEDYRPVADVFTETIEEIEARQAHEGTVGVPTGFYDLDDLTGGLHPGQMVVVAARPAMGKSTLALDFARAASVHHNLTSVIFSLEMTRTEITTRLIAAEAKVSLSRLRSGDLSEDDWAHIMSVMHRITSAPFFIDDSPNMTMTAIRAKARRLKQRHDLKAIFVDYMQLMTSGQRVENRQVEVSEFSRQMKLLAKELEVPVVALSQLNRGPEQRTSKRPMLSDLRESGAIEQDADVVILLHREDMYDKEATRPGEADLIVAKHRNGPTRDITVAFQGHFSRFVDMAR